MLLDPVRLADLGRSAATWATLNLESRLMPLLQRRLEGRGHDDTDGSARRTCLVVAAHPVDAVSGCGATVARKRGAGTTVWVAVVTSGPSSADPTSPPRRADAEQHARRTIEALRALGVPEANVCLLGFEAGSLERCGPELTEAVGQLWASLGPEEVLAPAGRGGGRDQVAVAAASAAADRLHTARGTLAAYPDEPVTDRRGTDGPGPGSLARQLLREAVGTARLPAPALVSTVGFGDHKLTALGALGATGPPLPAPLGAWELFLPGGVIGPGATPGDRLGRAPGRSRRAVTEAPCAPIVGVRDDFADDRRPGEVLGRASSSGVERRGVDVEATLSIDHGELRMATLATPGFGRQGLAYGPMRRTPGLTAAFQVLNSHNTAQSNILPEGRKAILRRLARDFPRGKLALPHLEDNLVVGFFPEPAPEDPRRGGNAFVMHAASTMNGELRAQVGGGVLRSYQGIQEVPLTYVVVLRERGAVYFASSVPGAEGAAAFPAMRPVAIDHAGGDELVYAGLMQAVHGEVGHEISTRVAAVRAEVVPGLAGGSPVILSDSLRGDGPLAGTSEHPTGTGGVHASPWRLSGGEVHRTGAGAVGGGLGGCAERELPWPAGLVHLVVDTAARPGFDARAGLVWRAGPAGAWRAIVDGDGCTLETRRAQGPWDVVARGGARLAAARSCSLQVVDDGQQFGVHLDGVLLFDRWFDDGDLAGQTGVGILTGPAAGGAVRDVDALPRSVAVPDLDLAAPWCRQGADVVVRDAFEGPPGELDGAWERTIGEGRFERTGAGSGRVVADAEHPNPGRTAYTVAWPDPGFADIEVAMTPPGSGRGQQQSGRGGLVFYESEDTYLLVNVWLDDAPIHDGSSVSVFFRSQGRERLYDAVWTNVGRRVTWGQEVSLRLAFDGSALMARLDGTPVLYRRVQDIYPESPRVAINRVGVAANWEWGDDTGTAFHTFVARRAGP